MNVQFDLNDLSPQQKEVFFNWNLPIGVGGAQKAKLTEERFRGVLNEGRPPITDYDFNSGEGTFFGKDRVELKQWSGDNNWKAQQVKPHLYDKILMCREEKEHSFWFVVKTSQISSQVSTLKNRHHEPGKLKLNGQHKGNLNEGMVQMDKNTRNFIKGITDTIIPSGKDEWSDIVTFIGKYPPLDYFKPDLGLSDNEILSILTFVKNY